SLQAAVAGAGGGDPCRSGRLSRAGLSRSGLEQRRPQALRSAVRQASRPSLSRQENGARACEIARRRSRDPGGKANQKSKFVAGEEWHTDVSCDAEPPMGSMLYITQTPEIGGGDTLFLSTVRAWEALSDT